MKEMIRKIAPPFGACFVLTFLLSEAVLPHGIAPFYLGGYASVLALGGNPIAASAAYLLARFLTGGAFALLQGAFSVVGVMALCLAGWITHRKFHPFYTVISAFLAELPMLFFLKGKGLFLFLGNSALSALFSLLLLRLMRRLRRGTLLVDAWDLFPMALAAFAFGAGAYGVMLFGVTPYYLLLAFLLPFFARVRVGGAMISLAFSLGGAAVSGNLFLPLGAALAWVTCESLRGAEKVAAFSLLGASGVLFLFGARDGSPLNLLLLFSGGMLAAFCPAALYRKAGARMGRSESSAARSVVNKARLDLSGKLGYVGDALRKMSDSLYALSEGEEGERVAKRLSSSLAAGLCEGCKGYRDCSAQGGGSTEALFEGTMLRALQNGKATICDLPPYLNGNCHKIKQLLEGLNEGAARYAEEKERARILCAERERMASEAEGIAGVLEVLRRDVRRVMTFDGKREKRILAELRRAGIPSYDAMVAEEDGRLEVTVTTEEVRAEDPRLLSALSRALDLPLIPESISSLGAGVASASFSSAPLYDAIVGQAVAVKEGSDACGDNRSITRLGGDRVMIALSDGMGSGGEAKAGSDAAITLVENFYRTGVDERVVLPLINRLLTLRNGDAFQTLDMCVVDLRSGEADFIKLSAPESVIKRKEHSEVVEGGALPLGILREVRPVITRRKLSSGDVVVLMTDGVTDAIGTDGALRVLESGRTNNPQTIAENLVRDASYVSTADDRTVVALRLFRRI